MELATVINYILDLLSFGGLIRTQLLGLLFWYYLLSGLIPWRTLKNVPFPEIIATVFFWGIGTFSLLATTILNTDTKLIDYFTRYTEPILQAVIIGVSYLIFKKFKRRRSMLLITSVIVGDLLALCLAIFVQIIMSTLVFIFGQEILNWRFE